MNEFKKEVAPEVSAQEQPKVYPLKKVYDAYNLEEYVFNHFKKREATFEEAETILKVMLNHLTLLILK